MKKILLALAIVSSLSYNSFSSNFSFSSMDTLIIPDYESFDIGFTLRLNFHFNNKGASNFSASAGVGVSQVLGGRDVQVTPSYQLNANFYSNGIGNNLHRNKRKFQIDFINSLALTFGVGQLDRAPRDMEIRTFNAMTSPTIRSNYYKFSATIGSNFVNNMNHRNQQVGFLGVDIWKVVKLGYYNDGPIFDKIGLGDSYDRWWTGGGFFELDGRALAKVFYWMAGKDIPDTLHYLLDTRYQIAYERFTGNVQDAYRGANYLGMSNVPPKSTDESLFNRGYLKFSVRHSDGWTAHYSILAPKKDFQDMIHDKSGKARHFSAARKERLLGFELDYNIWNRTIRYDEE